jgi:hypothetical protein
MRTPAAPLRRTGRLCRELCPGRSRYSFVPGSVAIRRATGSPPQPEGPVRPGSRTGRVVRRSSFSGGAAAGVGWTLGWCFGTKPVSLRQLRADLVVSPDPPPRRTPLRTPGDPAVAGAAGVPSKRQVAGAATQDIPERTRGPLTVVCHRRGWPPRLPLGVGSPAAPWLSVSRSAGHQRPPSCGACDRRRGPACGPAPTVPWPCPAWTPAVAASR